MEKNQKNYYFGPWRIKPGGLSVSRTFGDIQSKLGKNNEDLGIVTSEPDVFEFDTDDLDFVFLASDGIFDVMSNKDVIDIIWATVDFY